VVSNKPFEAPAETNRRSSVQRETSENSSSYFSGSNLQRWIPSFLKSKHLNTLLDWLGEVEYRRRRIVSKHRPGKPSFTSVQEQHVILAMLPTFWKAVIYKNTIIYGNWSYSLKISSILDATDPIWKVCREGNALELQRIFDRREASPFVLDPLGDSLLMVRKGCLCAGYAQILTRDSMLLRAAHWK
jgi:hypothetical protein